MHTFICVLGKDLLLETCLKAAAFSPDCGVLGLSFIALGVCSLQRGSVHALPRALPSCWPVCASACLASPHNFARFHKLDVTAPPLARSLFSVARP